MVAASTSMEDREAKVDEAAMQIERDLTLIGATAIEDRLQDQVSVTIMTENNCYLGCYCVGSGICMNMEYSVVF